MILYYIFKVISGATSGIGAAFCKILAKRGFNICAIARNKDKGLNLEKELKKINPDIKFELIIFDFSKSLQEGIFDEVVEKLKNLDIGILVNNVGILKYGIYF